MEIFPNFTTGLIMGGQTRSRKVWVLSKIYLNHLSRYTRHRMHLLACSSSWTELEFLRIDINIHFSYALVEVLEGSRMYRMRAAHRINLYRISCIASSENRKESESTGCGEMQPTRSFPSRHFHDNYK